MSQKTNFDNENAHARNMPNDVNTERSLVGAAMLDHDVSVLICEELSDGHFYCPKAALVFVAIKALVQKKEIVELTSVASILTASGDLESAGGLSVLMSFIQNAFTSTNASYYIDVLKRTKARRDVVRVGGDISSLGYDAKNEDVDDAIQSAEAKMLEVRKSYEGTSQHRSISETAIACYKAMADRSVLAETSQGTPSGFRAIDTMIGGLQKKDLFIIAARPSMGKTALAVTIALHVGVKLKKSVAIFSMEMGEEQILMRMFSTLSEVPFSAIKSTIIDQEGWKRIHASVESLCSSGLSIYDQAMLSVNDIKSHCRRKLITSGLDLIVIDYLQLMRGSSSSQKDGREKEVSEISRGLKALAKEFDVPVIALSQLNRGVESRNDKRPIMSDLRESGAIEQDADIIAFVYRDEYYNPETQEPGIADFIISKHRNGPTGTVKLRFDGHLTRFRDV